MKRHEDEEISNELSPEAVQNQVERILGSEKFARSKRLRSLLRFTVQQTLQGHADTLKEYVIGTEVLKKPDSYDPRRDSLVRVLAGRPRRPCDGVRDPGIFGPAAPARSVAAGARAGRGGAAFG